MAAPRDGIHPVSENHDAAAVSFTAHTDVGATRRINEDSYLAESNVFLVADGMGGHARGDRASQTAVRVFAERTWDGRVSPEDVLDAVHAANAAVRGLSTESDSGTAVAGTTLAGLVRVLAGSGETAHWMVFNIGDSRVYSWDGRRLAQLSVDHSAVQELLLAGAIDPHEAAAHPDRNVITRALGAVEKVDVDIWLLPVRGRQTFLVCSDGLCRELDDESIGTIIAEDSDHSASSVPLATRLVDAAVHAGGRDNVTAIVIESNAENVSSELDETIDRSGAERVLEDTRPRG
jgi:serine/threonine protein phosphatase PrpC